MTIAMQPTSIIGLEDTNTIGYYRLLALNANAFIIDLPDQRTEPLLPI